MIQSCHCIDSTINVQLQNKLGNAKAVITMRHEESGTRYEGRKDTEKNKIFYIRSFFKHDAVKNNILEV